MFVKRVRTGKRTYYYISRYQAGTDKQETLARIGSIDGESPMLEKKLLHDWIDELIINGSVARDKRLVDVQQTKKAKEHQQGRSFDYDRCVDELRQVFKKYGKISKILLEKQARPNREISWGVQTIFKNLKRRGKTLGEVFALVSDG